MFYLCHCIGARTALEYYSRHPESVLMILLKKPVLDSFSDFERFSGELKTIKTLLDLEAFCQKLEKKDKHLGQ